MPYDNSGASQTSHTFKGCRFSENHRSCNQRYYLTHLRPRQNGRHFADDTFKCIFLNENVEISIKNSLKLVPKGQINNIPALVQVMAWRRSGDTFKCIFLNENVEISVKKNWLKLVPKGPINIIPCSTYGINKQCRLYRILTNPSIAHWYLF